MIRKLFRPEVLNTLSRWQEMAGAVAFGLVGVWIFTFGGWFFQGIGILFVVVGGLTAIIAFRRMQFRREVAQPGIIEVDEGQIRFFGPQGGGFIALREMVELDLILDPKGESWWHLREAGGEILTVPVSAAGAEALFDAFATLPGIDMGALSAAVSGRDPAAQMRLWRRDGTPQFKALERS